jgi:mRNA-degrading endonuclease toxin of MazEF toxin-antitoxin module
MARGDVLLVSLPPSDRREQSGRRPAVAVQTDQAGEPMLMVAPVTPNLAALRFLLFTPRTLGRKRSHDAFRGHGFSDEGH